MFAAIHSILGWKKEKEVPVPSPPSVTITGVRIPADGTPAHLLSLTTTTDAEQGTDGFLSHIPTCASTGMLETAGTFAT